MNYNLFASYSLRLVILWKLALCCIVRFVIFILSFSFIISLLVISYCHSTHRIDSWVWLRVAIIILHVWTLLIHPICHLVHRISTRNQLAMPTLRFCYLRCCSMMACSLMLSCLLCIHGHPLLRCFSATPTVCMTGIFVSISIGSAY